jgi:hypothetical protein
MRSEISLLAVALFGNICHVCLLSRVSFSRSSVIVGSILSNCSFIAFCSSGVSIVRAPGSLFHRQAVRSLQHAGASAFLSE